MAIAVVAHVSISGTSAGFSNEGSLNTSGADCILAAVGFYQSGTLTDSKGNTYVDLGVSVGVDPELRLYYVLGPTVGSGHTWSGTMTYAGVSILALSGVLQVSPIDGLPVSASGSGTSIQPGSITPSADGAVWVTGMASNFTGSAPAINSPFTAESIIDHPSGAANYAVGIGWDIQTTATARNPTWSWTNSRAAVALGVVLKAAAGGGGGAWLSRLSLLGAG